MKERFPDPAEFQRLLPHIEERLDAALEKVGDSAPENGEEIQSSTRYDANFNEAASNEAASNDESTSNDNLGGNDSNGNSNGNSNRNDFDQNSSNGNDFNGNNSNGNGDRQLGIAPENGLTGLGYGGDRDTQEILHEYREAARANPDSSRHQADLAEGYAAADQPHKALRQYQRALQTQRENGQEEMPDAHLGIGDLCRTFALSAAAVRSYERAVRLRPERSFYRWKLAVALAAMGLYEQSVAQMSKAIELAPRDTYYRFQLADVYLLMQRDDDAIRELQRVVELAPRDDYYRLRLGAALIRNGRARESIAHFERAWELQPQNASYRTLLRYALTRNGQEPAISVDIDILDLGSYDEDFVRRIQRMAEET